MENHFSFISAPFSFFWLFAFFPPRTPPKRFLTFYNIVCMQQHKQNRKICFRLFFVDFFSFTLECFFIFVNKTSVSVCNFLCVQRTIKIYWIGCLSMWYNARCYSRRYWKVKCKAKKNTRSKNNVKFPDDAISIFVNAKAEIWHESANHSLRIAIVTFVFRCLNNREKVCTLCFCAFRLNEPEHNWNHFQFEPCYISYAYHFMCALRNIHTHLPISQNEYGKNNNCFSIQSEL